MEWVSLSFLFNSNDSFYPACFLDFQLIPGACLGSEC